MSEAPTTPATTAKVVTAPSVAPYIKSSIDHFNKIYSRHSYIVFPKKINCIYYLDINVNSTVVLLPMGQYFGLAIK